MKSKMSNIKGSISFGLLMASAFVIYGQRNDERIEGFSHEKISSSPPVFKEISDSKQFLKNKYARTLAEKFNMETYQKLRHKAILTEVEKEELDKFFLGDSLVKAFLKFQTIEPSFERIEERLDIVNMIIYGLRIAKDKNELFEVAKKMVLIPIKGQTEEEKRIEIGDKMDLVYELNKIDPIQVEELVSLTRGTKLENIIQYVKLKGGSDV